MKQNTSQRIAADIRAQIRSGALAPGARVPSARQIVRQYKVAIATAARAHALLRREGLVRAEAGVGLLVRGERGVELSRARIVQAAIAIADDEGTTPLTMRLLARELGVSTMALYRHVRSRDELLLQMADAVLAEEAPPRPRGDWRLKLEALARQQWAGYRRHTWLASWLSMSRPQPLANGMRHTEAVLAALDRLGLDDATVLRTGVAFLAFVRGMAASLELERQDEQDTGMASDEWMEAQKPLYAAQLARLPTLARLSDGPDVPMGLDQLFECGLSYFLDGIAARLARKK